MNEFRLDPERLDFTLIGAKESACKACGIKSQEVAAIPFRNGMIKSYEIRDDIQPSKYELSGTQYKSSGAHGYQEIIVENADHADKFKSYSVEESGALIESLMKRVQDISRHGLGDNILLTRHLNGHGYTELSVLPIPKFVKTRCFECDAAASTYDREILASENFVAFSPFAPRFPEEIHILPKKHIGMLSIDPIIAFDLAAVLNKVVNGVNDRDRTLIISQTESGHMKIALVRGGISAYSFLGINKIDNRPEDYAKDIKGRLKT